MTSRIAFIGEWPCLEDTITGRPFSGSSGRVFNQMMRSANLDRDQYLLTNAFDQCLPDDEETSLFIKDEALVKQNSDRLNKELEDYDPSVIVPLGAIALWAFTGETLISKYRGATTAATKIRVGAKLLPTYHPAAIQKSWKLLPLAVGDLVRAAEEADLGPGFHYPHVELLIEPTVDDVRRFCEEECTISRTRKLSVDIETGWGQITSIALAPSTAKAMAIPFIDLRQPNKCYWRRSSDELDVWRSLRTILNSPVPKVGQNFVYDAFWLLEQRGIGVRNYRHDTRLKHKVLFPELPADLGTMSASYTRIGAYKTWGGRYQKDTEKKDG